MLQYSITKIIMARMNADIFQALLDWNPWIGGEFPDELMGYKRHYHLIDYLDVPEIKIIEGARRVGKSTLLYQVIHHVLQTSAHVLYINFEDEILKQYSLAEVVYTYLEHGKIDYLFVDEIQNCTDWVSFIRKIYDRREISQLWVSGSNSSLIKQEYATLLTGRNLPIHIYPLSFHEFLAFKSNPYISLPVSNKQEIELRKLFSEYMEFGAFPAVANRNVLKKELLLAYFDDFIYKDIVARYNINAIKLKELAIYLATNASKSFSYRNIAALLNCHINTVTDYVGYMKQAFLFEELYKFDYSLQKQFITDKKIYCLDTGLAAAVSFRFSEDKGRILENIVYCELRRLKQTIYFHKNITECDFIIKKELDIVAAIQVCVTLAEPGTKQREINGLIDALQTYKLQSGLILTQDEDGCEQIIVNDVMYTIQIKPVWKWLLTH